MTLLILVVADRVAHAEWQKKGFPDVAAVRHAMSEPGLIDMPRNTTGAAISRYTPGQGLLETTCAPFVLDYSREFRRAGGFHARANRRGYAYPVNLCPERKSHPICGRWRGGTPRCASRCWPGSSAKRPCQRRRVCRRQASCWIAAGAKRFSLSAAMTATAAFASSSANSSMSPEKPNQC
jgi:hypothetical protein